MLGHVELLVSVSDTSTSPRPLHHFLLHFSCLFTPDSVMLLTTIHNNIYFLIVGIKSLPMDRDMEAAAEAAEGESSFSSTISDNSSLSESHSNSKTRRLTSSVTSHDSHLRSRPLSLPAQSFNNLQTETTQNNSVRAASFSYRGSVCKPNFQIRSYSSVVFSVQVSIVM